jgi:two-component system, chemotaxis family, chemotaxis protein CheY
MRMLVIDDSKTMRSFLSYIARDLSFQTQEACDGQDALDVLKKSDPFDVALVDWDMPRMNGLDFVKNVRSNPSYANMKLMMVTAQSSLSAIIEALDSGANDYLMKPITKEMVSDKLRVLGVIE